jgi:hypothetical protein
MHTAKEITDNGALGVQFSCVRTLSETLENFDVVVKPNHSVGTRRDIRSSIPF